MTKLNQIVDPTALTAHIHEGWIRRQNHPTEPYSILKYSSKCQTNWHFNETTNVCRGLAYNETTGDIVARGFDKFFESTQPGAPTFAADEFVVAFEKLDGSCGLIYPLTRKPGADRPGGEFAVATMGSFSSTQALKATDMWHANYKHSYQPRPDRTTIVEIIFPANRIVLDYGRTEGLFYLGEIDNATGTFYYNPEDWPVQEHISGIVYQGRYDGVVDVLDRPDTEGLVVWAPRTDQRIKLKRDEYLRLHRICTNLSKRVVFEYMRENQDFAAAGLIEKLPLAHAAWAQQVAHDIRAAYLHTHLLVTELGMAACTELKVKTIVGLDRSRRKDLALFIKDQPPLLKAAIFSHVDGKGSSGLLWKSAEPPPDDEVVRPPGV